MSRSSYKRTWMRNRRKVVAMLGTDSDSEEETLGSASNVVATPSVLNDMSLSSDASVSSESNCSDSSVILSEAFSDSEGISVDSQTDCEDDETAQAGTEDVSNAQATPFDQRLAKWAIDNRLSRKGLGDLLSMLKAEGHDLPKDPRTLLNTPRSVSVSEKCGGQYLYIGIEEALKNCLLSNMWFLESGVDVLELSVNIDGVPLFSSCPTEFWPILISFGNFKPLLVALYMGDSKPTSVKEYLEDFLKEYKCLSETGLLIHDKLFQVSLLCFICDVPARAFVKCIKGHAGFYCCERCGIKGIKVEHRLTLPPGGNWAARTDEDFNNCGYLGSHQMDVSPLIELGFSCVSRFPLDYMHLVCLGVVKRLLFYLVNGPRICKLSKKSLKTISARLKFLRNKLPRDFARQPRSLSLLKYWKATELRQFLLYTSIVVLRGVVSDEVYQQILHLSVGISILLDPSLERRTHYLPFAKQLLRKFVSKCPGIFSKTFVVHNVHALTHLADDVSFFSRSLNEISCFPFENHLQSIKKCVRNANNPIAQVAKRLSERLLFPCTSMSKDNFRISTAQRDCCFHREDEYVIVKERKKNGFWRCDTIKKRNGRAFFDLELDDGCFHSDQLGIIFVRTLNKVGREKIIHTSRLTQKAICMPYKDGYVLMPMLHCKEVDA